MALITLVEYARRHGKEPIAARHKAQRGGFSTAVKLGRDWFIDEDETWEDRRIKSGDYIGTHRARMEKALADSEKDET